MRRARSQKCELDNIVFDSIAEACFYRWCVEAMELGVITNFKIQPVYPLTNKKTISVEKVLKTKTKRVSRTLLQESNYTGDFTIWSDLDIGLIGQCGVMPYDVNTGIYDIDVKGSHQPPGSAAKFSLTQKFLYDKHNIYVNKVVIAYDSKKYSAKKCATGFFAMNGVPEQLPAECYQKCGTKLYAVWHRMFDGLPSIKEVVV